MGHLLVKLFIPNFREVQAPKVRENYGRLAGKVGIISNLLLCISKILVGILSSSIAIIADGINNLSDASSSVITLVGFRLSAMPEDKDHPYGHARIEYLTGLLISVVIIVVGLLLLKSSVEKIIDPEPVVFTLSTLIVLLLAIAIKVWQMLFYRYMGRAISSLALKAASADSRNDVISTTVVLAGLIITNYTGLLLDGFLGLLVALFIIWSGIQLIRETSSPLLGEAPDQELVDSIISMVKAHEGVLGIHDLMVHNYGPGKIFASLHIEVDADGDLMESHDMIDNIEREVKASLQIYFVAHMDPIRKSDPLLQDISNILYGKLAYLDGVLDFHDLRIVPGTTHSNIIFDLEISPGCPHPEEYLSSTLEQAIQRVYPKFFAVITFDRAYTDLS